MTFRECGACLWMSDISAVTCQNPDCGLRLVMSAAERVLAKNSGTGAAARRINNIATRRAA